MPGGSEENIEKPYSGLLTRGWDLNPGSPKYEARILYLGFNRG
jgi:hypothetical protein